MSQKGQLCFRLSLRLWASSTCSRARDLRHFMICLDCQRHVGVHIGRGRLNYHFLMKGRPCKPLLRKKRAQLQPGFNSPFEFSQPGSASGAAEQPPAGIG
eukprot:1821486-Amphidinium_carterae.1